MEIAINIALLTLGLIVGAVICYLVMHSRKKNKTEKMERGIESISQRIDASIFS